MRRPSARRLARVAFLATALSILEGAARRHGLHLVDLHARSREVLPGRPAYFSPDGLHPSDAGYEAWAESLWPAFEDLARQALGKADFPA